MLFPLRVTLAYARSIFVLHISQVSPQAGLLAVYDSLLVTPTVE